MAAHQGEDIFLGQAGVYQQNLSVRPELMVIVPQAVMVRQDHVRLETFCRGLTARFDSINRAGERPAYGFGEQRESKSTRTFIFPTL